MGSASTVGQPSNDNPAHRAEGRPNVNKQKKIEELAEACQNVYAAADLEERGLSRSERKTVEENLTRIKALRADLAVEKKIHDVGVQIGVATQ
jgi:hypothetical protein